MKMSIKARTDKAITDFTNDVIEAFKLYDTAESKVPKNEYEKGYKSRNSKANRMFKEFSAICKNNGLNNVQTCWDLQALLKKENQ